MKTIEEIGIEIEKMQIKQGDTLIMKYPCDDKGTSLFPLEAVTIWHNHIKKITGCNVITMPKEIEIIKE
ncbi:hypothetical protein [Clostridium sp.]|uniref:hypothetical protein n=1 Tax=Clostridium sp. TaxID=1506 RepID=UPI003F2CEBF6